MFVPSARNSLLAATGLAIVLVSTSGCGFFRRLAGNDTVDLKKAQVASMSVDLRRQQKTICPREPVQMAVFAKVTLEGDKEAKDVETWQGKAGANKNDKMDFSDFAFHSEQGTFDQDGWFTPSPNILVTATKELEIKSVFRARPDKFSFATTYKPDYGCIKQAGKSGQGGQEGHSGESGESGQSGSQGANGGAGSPGGQGANGTDGQPGIRLTAYATMVKTPFYEKLVAVRITGDYQDFVLVPEGAPFTLRAAGGAGGRGGHGGSGGRGGAGGSAQYVGGNGGQGAGGGNGGTGANGGAGGSIDLVFDERFPDLAKIVLEAPGGEAGPPGGAGEGGAGGSGGSGTGQGGKSGAQGAAGPRGAPGTPGRRGADGRVSSKSGSVTDQFVAELPKEIAVLGLEPPPAATTATATPEPAEPTAKDAKAAKAAKGKSAEKKANAKPGAKKQKQKQ